MIYGFGSYGRFRDNITERIIKSLPSQPGLKKTVFPVRFHRGQFIDLLKRFKPDIVLGLGQSSRRRIDVEAQALNRRRARRPDKPQPISSGGPKRLKTTLQLHLGKQVRKSASAGDYVCNFSMYVILDHIRRNRIDIPYGFVHIPHNYDPKKATEMVKKILHRCQRA